MERFVLEGRKLNGPPAAREVNATLKQRTMEDECVLFVMPTLTCQVFDKFGDLAASYVAWLGRLTVERRTCD